MNQYEMKISFLSFLLILSRWILVISMLSLFVRYVLSLTLVSELFISILLQRFSSHWTSSSSPLLPLPPLSSLLLVQFVAFRHNSLTRRSRTFSPAPESFFDFIIHSCTQMSVATCTFSWWLSIYLLSSNSLLYFLNFLLCRSSNKSIHISLSKECSIRFSFPCGFIFRKQRTHQP